MNVSSPTSHPTTTLPNNLTKNHKGMFGGGWRTGSLLLLLTILDTSTGLYLLKDLEWGSDGGMKVSDG